MEIFSPDVLRRDIKQDIPLKYELDGYDGNPSNSGS